MAKTAAEIMKEYVRSQNFTSTDEIMAAMKDMFKDVLQEVMECELSEELGYEKSERLSDVECNNKSKNYRKTRPSVCNKGCLCCTWYQS